MTQVTPGLDPTAQALNEVQQIIMPLAEKAIGLALEALHEKMALYPTQPDRDRANPGNKPSPYNTYVRGIGHFPRSAFHQSNGQWVRKKKGAYKPGPKGGKVRRTSEQLNAKWRMSVRAQGDGVQGELRNDASYSGGVLGHIDQSKAVDGIPMQAAPHTLTGWPNIDDALASVMPKIEAGFDAAIDNLFKQIKAV